MITNRVERGMADRSLPAGRMICYRLFFWILIFIAFLCFCFLNWITLFLIIAICVVIYRGSQYFGKKFNFILFPQSIIKKIKRTKIFKIYFIAALRRQVTAAMMVATFFPALWIYIFFPQDWINPVLDIHDFVVYKGFISKVHVGGRRHPIDYIWLRTEEGENIKLEGSLSKDNATYLKKLTPKDEVIVWSQNIWDLPPNIRIRDIRQIKHNNHIVIKYNKKRYLQSRAFCRTIDTLCILWILLMLIIVWIKANKYLLEQEKNG